MEEILKYNYPLQSKKMNCLQSPCKYNQYNEISNQWSPLNNEFNLNTKNVNFVNLMETPKKKLTNKLSMDIIFEVDEIKNTQKYVYSYNNLDNINFESPEKINKKDFFKKNKKVFSNSTQSNSINKISFFNDNLPKINYNTVDFFNKNYNYIKKLGQGNFGKIILVKNKIDFLTYACKIVNAINIKTIKNEIYFISALSRFGSSKYIIRYYNCWKTDKDFFLITEACLFSLQDEIDKNIIFDEKKILKIILNICKGLKFLNKKNLVHMDIKPENILFGYDKKYKLGDLGLSNYRYLEKNNEIDEGDSHFMAQELLVKKERLDLSKSDIFSLGITIYYLMKRIKPKKNGIIFKKLRNNELNFDKMDYYSNDLKNLVREMMNKDWKKRPTCNEIIDKINSIKSPNNKIFLRRNSN